MKILAQLRSDLDKSQAAITELLDAEAKGTLDEAQTARFHELESEAAALQAKIDRREKHLADMRARASAEVDSILADENLGNQITSIRERLDDDPKMGFGSVGEFAVAVFNAFNPGGAIRDERLRFAPAIGAAATGMSQGVGADGGFAVPPEFSQMIWDGMQGASESLLRFCDVYTVTGESLTFPAVDESSRAAGSRWGGIRGYWIAEAAQMTSSKPKLRQMKLEPQQLAVLVYVTDKLLNNAPAMQQFLLRAAIDELNFMIGDAIVNGTGVGQPKGILATGPTVSVAKETSQAADTILAANIDKMSARLHPRGASRAVWLHNHDCLPQLKNLFYAVTNVAGSENVGGYNAAIYDRRDKTLDGLPAIDCEYCATVGDAGDIILADLQGYAVGIKGGVRTDMSMHLRFDYNETAFRFLYAIDGQPWLTSAITPYKGSATLSTFVKLAARA